MRNAFFIRATAASTHCLASSPTRPNVSRKYIESTSGLPERKIEADRAAGFDDEHFPAGPASDFDGFTNGLDLGRNDEGARIEITEHGLQHRIIRARRFSRSRRPENHRMPAKIIDSENDRLVAGSQGNGRGVTFGAFSYIERTFSRISEMGLYRIIDP